MHFLLLDCLLLILDLIGGFALMIAIFINIFDDLSYETTCNLCSRHEFMQKNAALLKESASFSMSDSFI